MRDAYKSPHPQSRVNAAGADIAYVDTGPKTAPPIVFLHGNPTSSYLWRNIIPHVSATHRCLAPDLAGMGNSGPMPSGTHTLKDHIEIIDAWFEALGLHDVTLVIHDWGSAIGFDWARRHPDRVAGIVYMEGIVAPRMWADFPEGRDKLFRRLRSEEGEKLVLEENYFVEVVLPRSILRDLTAEEMDAYRAPFPEVEQYAAFMKDSPIPKLFINAEPGAIISGSIRDICRAWANQTEITVKGIHFIQEDSAEEIGRALSEFVL
jgi:haloalkane dehalogenase